MSEFKSVYEVKAAISDSVQEISKGKREIIGKFADYTTHDLIGDLSHKGMFDKSWKEGQFKVKFLYEHDTTKVVGKISTLWDDDKGAYYKATIGTHNFGNDIMEMAEAGLLDEHSFGYYVVRGPKNKAGGRDLKEVKHIETTIIGGKNAVHPNTPMIALNKDVSKEDVFERLQKRYKALETFCRNSSATDETIEDMTEKMDLLFIEIKQLQQTIIDLSVSSTPAADEALEPQKGIKSFEAEVMGVQNNIIILKNL